MNRANVEKMTLHIVYMYMGDDYIVSQFADIKMDITKGTFTLTGALLSIGDYSCLILS